ncbi:MAG: S9 family peptidase [Tissierellia bacterium]|nr:S9 family peptidase [Tissierellia bacterium]
MDKLEVKDFINYDFVSNINFSKNKDKVCFIKSKANLKENKYDSNLYLIDVKSGKEYQLTDENDTSTYLIDEDSNIIFKKSQDAYDYFYIKDDSISVKKEYFKLKLNVSYIKELKKGMFLIKGTKKLSKEEKKKEKDDSYFKEISSLPFWFNGMGYLDFKDEDFYIYDKEKDDLKKIATSNRNNWISTFDIDEKYFVYTKIVFEKDTMSMSEDLILKDLDTCNENVILNQKFAYHDVFLINEKIAFIGSKRQKHGINEDPFVYTIDLDGQNLKKITKDDFDMDFSNSVGTDIRYGATRTFKKSNDKIYFIATEKDISKLFSIDLDGNVEKVIEKENVEDFDIVGNDIVYSTISKDEIYNIYINDRKIASQKSLYKTSDIETFEFESNGANIKGYVLKPIDFDKNKKYPTLLSVHGGPKTVFSDIFHHENQVFANNGYFVIYTNPHGSSSHGVDFSDIRGKYGTIDYEDLMTFTDEAIKRYPQIDKDKLGVLGGSYGGFMTNWIIGHTDRFKAANSQRSISNWTSFYGVSDIGYYFASDQTDANPWTSLDKMWEQSPIKYAKNVKTPTLFIHSDSDFRCPLEQGLQMYTAINLNKVDTKMYIFKGENHELSRSGKPKARVKRLSEILNWFDKYLK